MASPRLPSSAPPSRKWSVGGGCSARGQGARTSLAQVAVAHHPGLTPPLLPGSEETALGPGARAPCTRRKQVQEQWARRLGVQVWSLSPRGTEERAACLETTPEPFLTGNMCLRVQVAGEPTGGSLRPRTPGKKRASAGGPAPQSLRRRGGGGSGGRFIYTEEYQEPPPRFTRGWTLQTAALPAHNQNQTGWAQAANSPEQPGRNRRPGPDNKKRGKKRKRKATTSGPRAWRVSRNIVASS